MISLRDVIEGTGGDSIGALDPHTLFRRVCHDSREVQSGDLFVALRGERFDGHRFLDDAFARGAVAALVDRAYSSSLDTVDARPLIVVHDSLSALQRLAAYWRSLFTPHVLGITGSVGKSSTKEAVAAVLDQRYSTVRNRGNFNNEIGLPLTLLEITPNTEAVVLEMGGAYAAGEIAQLCGLARPRIGIVTNVSHSHLARMGSLEAIAATKRELVESLPPDGVAILNGDDERVRAMADSCRARVILFGTSSGCQLRADEIESRGLAGISFRLWLNGDDHQIRVPLLGRHSAHTALAAFAAGWSLGMSVDEMLPAFTDPAVQLRLYTVPGVNESIIIDDTYNANPASTIAALNLLRELDAPRRIAVLGDMLELGSYEIEGHRLVGRRAAVAADYLLTLGPRARLIAEEARSSGLPPESIEQFDALKPLADRLVELLQPGDIVLVKGSRGLAMEQVVEHVRDQDVPA